MSDLARTPAQIGNSVRRARKSLGWSQTELGNRAGLRQETISLIETGKPAARIDTILAVIAALDHQANTMKARHDGSAAHPRPSIDVFYDVSRHFQLQWPLSKQQSRSALEDRSIFTAKENVCFST